MNDMFYAYVDASFRRGKAGLGCHIVHGYRSWDFTARVRCHDSFEAEALAIQFGLYRLALLNRQQSKFVLYTDHQSLADDLERRPDLAEIRNRLELLAPNGHVAWCSRDMAGMRRADELAYG